MTPYMRMWTKIKELTVEERKQWIDDLYPVKGVGVDFFGVQVTDIDLSEALKNSIDIISIRK